jgi:hypothetical protein
MLAYYQSADILMFFSTVYNFESLILKRILNALKLKRFL